MTDPLLGAAIHWQLLGCAGPDAAHPCRLIASGRLAGTWHMEYRRLSHTLNVSVSMDGNDVLFIDGPNWQACFAMLQEQWQPGTGENGERGGPRLPLDHSHGPPQLGGG